MANSRPTRQNRPFCRHFSVESPPHGEMAEWSIAAVLKTAEPQGSGGSNPSLSATKRKGRLNVGPFLFALIASARRRSEEHTSELQSLMRISYAVFCLKKKKTQIKKH